MRRGRLSTICSVPSKRRDGCGWMGERGRIDGWEDPASRDVPTGVCLGLGARKPLNPLIYLAVLFDMELMRSLPLLCIMHGARFSVYRPLGEGERSSADRLNSRSAFSGRWKVPGGLWVWFARAAASRRLRSSGSRRLFSRRSETIGAGVCLTGIIAVSV